MAQMCPAKSTIVPFKKQMYSSGSIILSYKDDKCICVSIHAPTRGATYNKTLELSVESFQSTHPRGVRQNPKVMTIHQKVSIHAPTRGATSQRSLRYCICSVSIHAPTRGATSQVESTTHGTRFQSTHPRGVRLVAP